MKRLRPRSALASRLGLRADLGVPDRLRPVSADADLLRRVHQRGRPVHARQLPRVLHRLASTCARCGTRWCSAWRRSITTSVIGIAVAFLIIRYEFPVPEPLLLPDDAADDPAAARRRARLRLHPRPRRHGERAAAWTGSACEHPINFMYGMHGVLLVETVHLFPLMTLSILDALVQGRPVAGGGRAGHGRERLAPVLGRHAAAHHARLHLRARCSSSSGPSPTSSRRWCVGVQDLLAPQAYLNIVQFVDRRIFRMGIVISALLVRARDRLRARRAPVRRDQGLQLARLLEGRAPPAGAGQALAGGRLPGRCCWSISFDPAGRRAARRGRPGLGAHAVPGALHARVLPAGEHRDAEVHHQLVPVLRASPWSCASSSACRWRGSWRARARPGAARWTRSPR